jgi:hypothetical protein
VSPRKFLAAVIMSTAIGTMIEMQLDDGRPWRAPLTGAATLGVYSMLCWAEHVLSEPGES